MIVIVTSNVVLFIKSYLLIVILAYSCKLIEVGGLVDVLFGRQVNDIWKLASFDHDKIHRLDKIKLINIYLLCLY